MSNDPKYASVDLNKLVQPTQKKMKPKDVLNFKIKESEKRDIVININISINDKTEI